MRQFTIDDLKNLKPARETFVGIDSDGCVFDTMDAKQKDHFHPAIIKHWGLQAIEPQVRAAAEFTYLYSKSRGLNRFIGLAQTLELLNDWDEAKKGAALPDPSDLKAFCESGLPLSNDTLLAEAKRTQSNLLKEAWQWSVDLNDDIDRNMIDPPPFKGAVEALQTISTHSDAIVISQTQAISLLKDWHRDNLAHYVQVIAGPELGSKIDHFNYAAVGKYAPGRILMIGDAPGDQRTAEAIGCAFYPINPGHEVESWQHFNDEAYRRFLSEGFSPEYQAHLIAAFDALLPATPPWKN
jgi:phosphoglycolate phosphatase-like HAD superfamily hydrolase